MYNYEQFKEALIGNLASALAPEGYEIKTVKKNSINQITESITANKKNSGKISVSAAVNISDVFENYLAGQNFDSIVNRIANVLVSDTERKKKITESFSYDIFKDEKILDNVVFDVINTGMNQELLSNVPSKSIEDLSVIYRLDLSEIMGCRNDSTATVLIDNKIQELIGVDTELLHERALRNMKTKFPIEITPMSEVLKSMMGTDFLEDAGNPFEQDFLYVMKGQNYMKGASSLVYCEDRLNELVDRTGKDFYILPSSIYEILLLPDDKLFSIKELKEMVKIVNTEEVKLSERLSDNVYKFTAANRKIELAKESERAIRRLHSR